MPHDAAAKAEAQTSLPASPEAIGRARRLLAQLLEQAGVGGGARHDALLVASELVTNAVSHGSRAGDDIHVGYELDHRRLRICVSDRVRGPSAPAALTPDEERPAGRGLTIVDELAHWSERVVDGRREVWAELTL